jgi:hypothetical protein
MKYLKWLLMLTHGTRLPLQGRPSVFTDDISGPSQQMLYSPMANSLKNESSCSPEEAAVIAINNIT